MTVFQRTENSYIWNDLRVWLEPFIRTVVDVVVCYPYLLWLRRMLIDALRDDHVELSAESLTITYPRETPNLRLWRHPVIIWFWNILQGLIGGRLRSPTGGALRRWLNFRRKGLTEESSHCGYEFEMSFLSLFLPSLSSCPL